jgi:hypothetical protein
VLTQVNGLLGWRRRRWLVENGREELPSRAKIFRFGGAHHDLTAARSIARYVTKIDIFPTQSDQLDTFRPTNGRRPSQGDNNQQSSHERNWKDHR